MLKKPPKNPKNPKLLGKRSRKWAEKQELSDQRTWDISDSFQAKQGYKDIGKTHRTEVGLWSLNLLILKKL